MGDIEMTPSQVAYSTLDASYPPEFWDEVSALNMDAQLPSTQGSSGSETAINSAATSLSDVVTASDTAAQSPRKLEQMLPKTPTKPTARFLESPRRPVNGYGSPSRSPRSMPSMAPPRGIASGSSSGNLFGSRPKRANPQTELPPSKIRKLSDRGIDCKATFPSRPASSKSITPGVKPASNGPKPFSLPYLFSGNHGVHLEPFVVFHSAELQSELDRLQIARGVQWELVRGIKSGSWTWDLVKAKLDKFTGTNAAIAPQLRDIILGSTSQKSCTPHEQALWEELDREVKATVENKSRGLGLMGEFEGVSNYFGGNIQCTIRLIYKGDDKEPNVRLEPLEMTRSNHLARELGSVSVIALRDDKGGALVRKWAARKFLFCGRVYIALPPKSSKVYLIETVENYGRKAQTWCGDQHRISYDDYIRKNNRMDFNDKQPFSKYLTRFNLYLSTSIPALEFSPDSISFIDDEYADGWSKEMNPSAEMIMTDGCGFLNRAAAEMISSKLQYERVPVAYQGRIAGSKGLWVIHPKDESDVPHIWIRDSQKKIQLRLPPRAHRIFNLLAVSGPSSSVNLSAQSIIILANNGVPSNVFCALQEQGLRDLITPLMDWHRPNATAYLWDAINSIGNVARLRLQRMAMGASRALGFEKRACDDINDRTTDDPTENDADLWDLPHTGRKAFSGEPVKASEAVMDLLQAGFDPRNSPFLSKKIHSVVKTTMEMFLAKYRIPLATSLEAYIIPDPSGQLKEGEVFFQSSISPDGPLQEKVVVGRYPMREPSDMQKVSAVNIPALSMYLDVLVISIHGSRSLASLLAGGDTDGDEAIIIRNPTIVDPFENQAVVSVPDTFQADNFENQVQTVSEFGKKLEKMSISEAQSTFQKEVVAGLKNDNIGKYSQYHDCAVYEYGLDDPRTRRMAHMTATLLDASKTGLRLKEEVEANDQTEYAKFLPRAKCFDIKGGHTRKRKRPFILDSLLAAGAVTKDELWVEFDKCAKEISESELIDGDLEGPYRHMEVAAAAVPAIAADLELLKARIEQSRAEWLKQFKKMPKNDPQPPWEQKTNRKKGPARQTDDVMLPVMRDFRQPHRSDDSFSILKELGVVDEIKASYAFTRSAAFGFSMAFQDVCEIKRKAEMKRGTFNRVAIIDDAKSMGGPARRLFKHMGS